MKRRDEGNSVCLCAGVRACVRACVCVVKPLPKCTVYVCTVYSINLDIKLELTGKSPTPSTTKHPGLETHCWEPLSLNQINEKKREREEMSPIPSSKIPDRESDNESTSKGERRPRRLQKARRAAHSGLLNR